MRPLLFTALAAGLLWAGGATDADAARCRPGKLYRPSMGVCMSKMSRAARPFIHKARFGHKRVRHARRYIGTTPRMKLRPPESEPKPRQIETATYYDGITTALSPYGALLKFPTE